MGSCRGELATFAVRPVNAMPANGTWIAAALNDTARELAASIGVAVVGTLIAALVAASLPDGRRSEELVHPIFRGERVIYTVLAGTPATTARRRPTTVIVCTRCAQRSTTRHATRTHRTDWPDESPRSDGSAPSGGGVSRLILGVQSLVSSSATGAVSRVG